MSLFKSIFGHHGGATKGDIIKASRRDSFSDFLPWLAYKESDQAYLNTDNTIGYIWECTPLTFAGTEAMEGINRALENTFPDGAVMQFMLYADPNITDFMSKFKSSKVRKDDLISKNVDHYYDFLDKGKRGFESLYNVPARNFRCFVTLKAKEKFDDNLIANLEEILNGVGLQPRRMLLTDFISFLRSLFNNMYENSPSDYDKNSPLRKQIINSDTCLEFKHKTAKIGDMYAKCFTPQTLPETSDSIKTNNLIGGHGGIGDDLSQYISPFLWTFNIIFDDVESEIDSKATVTGWQKASGSFASQIAKRLKEFNWVTDAKKQGKFVKVIPILWIFASTEEELKRASSKAVNAWSKKKYKLQEESVLQKILFIASLPFGLYNVDNNLEIIDRHFIMPTATAATMTPIQGDFRGSNDPVVPFIGRKGQVIGLNLFDKTSNNHNFLKAAESGGGKSFMENFISGNHYAAGAKVRIIDIGYSYKKLCASCNGRFLDFGVEHQVINPFHCSSTSEEDIKHNLVVASNIIASMVYSASHKDPDETERTLIKSACQWVHDSGDIDYGIDRVIEYLRSYPKYYTGDTSKLQFAEKKAAQMQFNMQSFSSTGSYGRFFNGKSTFDISSDDFLVLELDRLKSDPELFHVVTLQLLNAITQDLYLSDRSNKRICIFEEAAAFLKMSSDSSMKRIATVIEEGYRRARKYNGSFGVVLQSLMDAHSFGDVGKVIKENSAYKFYLQSTPSVYDDAKQVNILTANDFELEIIKSVQNNKPRYSEVFLDTPQGKGCARLAVDRWNYWVNTSSADEVARFEFLLKEGKTPVEALSQLSGIH